MKYPEQTENYDVDVFNGNFRELDLKGEQLGRDLKAESERAKAAEATNAGAISAEVSRAKSAEKANSDAISAETDRAMAQEGIIDSKFTAEAAAIRALIDMAYASANGYTDEKIAALVDGAPGALDTLKEIADALEQNEDVVDALNDAIGTKANKNEFESHAADTDIHVTAAEKSAWNNPQFTKAPTRDNLNSGDSTPTLWGKAKKWFSDLKAVAFSGSYNDLSDKPILGNALIRITQGGVEKGSFTTNQAGDDVVIALEEGGSGVDPEDITPESIGAVAKSGDTMSGNLTVNIPQPSGDLTGRRGLSVREKGTYQNISITASEIEAITEGGVGTLRLNPEGSKSRGLVEVGSALKIDGGMTVNNALAAGSADDAYFMCFNSYTADASGGIVKYRGRADMGFADQWHWQTGANNLFKFYKIRILSNEHGIAVNSMFSFNLEVYQSYQYWKVSISGYRYTSSDDLWYEPKAALIEATNRGEDGFRIVFGKDPDGVIWIAFPAMMYTGISICNLNLAYIDCYDFDPTAAFELVTESSISGKIVSDQYVYRPVKKNEFDELKNSVSDGKAQVASAITSKGIYVATDAPFATFATAIKSLPYCELFYDVSIGIWWMNNSTSYDMGEIYIGNSISSSKYADIYFGICASSSANADFSPWNSRNDWEAKKITYSLSTYRVSDGTLVDNATGDVMHSSVVNPYGIDALKSFAGCVLNHRDNVLLNGSDLRIKVHLTCTKTSFEIVSLFAFAFAVYHD